MGPKVRVGDTQAPWQKGSVASLNKRARRYLPRDTAIAALSDHATAGISAKLNATPTHRLGYRDAREGAVQVSLTTKIAFSIQPIT